MYVGFCGSGIFINYIYVVFIFCCFDYYMDIYFNEIEYKFKKVYSSYFIISKFSGKR